MKTIELKDLKGDQTLLEILTAKGVPMRADCGGSGVCGKCRIKADGEWLLACEARLTGDAVVEVPDSGEDDIHVESSLWPFKADGRNKGMAVCVDIGTTTIAAALVDRTAGTVTDMAGSVNHQRIYGSSVISRIEAAGKGMEPEMTRLVREDIAKLKAALLHGRDEDITDTVISGNTTMEHLYMGYPCEGLGVAPYKPYDISLVKKDGVVLLPGASAFVGADIVSGICVLGMDQSSKLCALMDLGTNGEMALGSSERMVVTSTAAGPAFEGGNISCGMAGVPGAISQVRIGYGGKVKTETISGVKAAGICGTGVVDTVSQLKLAGIIDKTGLLADEYFDEGFPLAEGVNFTQKDVREVQMAKGAVRAGLETLMKEYGAEAGDIDTLYLCGGFGQKIDVDSACSIGIIPPSLKNKVVAAGNTSLAGAAAFACDSSMAQRMTAAAEMCEEIELARNGFFSEAYIKYMNFD